MAKKENSKKSRRQKKEEKCLTTNTSQTNTSIRTKVSNNAVLSLSVTKTDAAPAVITKEAPKPSVSVVKKVADTSRNSTCHEVIESGGGSAKTTVIIDERSASQKKSAVVNESESINSSVINESSKKEETLDSVCDSVKKMSFKKRKLNNGQSVSVVPTPGIIEKRVNAVVSSSSAGASANLTRHPPRGGEVGESGGAVGASGAAGSAGVSSSGSSEFSMPPLIAIDKTNTRRSHFRLPQTTKKSDVLALKNKHRVTSAAVSNVKAKGDSSATFAVKTPTLISAIPTTTSVSKAGRHKSGLFASPSHVKSFCESVKKTNRKVIVYL